MDSSRSVEDRLREEYFDLLPEVRRTLLQTETRVRGLLLDVSLSLERYERLLITARIKECDSAINALRRRQLLRLFDQERTDGYSLTSLRDLAAVRVLAFPQHVMNDAHAALRPVLADWTADPIPDEVSDSPLAHKYYGTWAQESVITAEVQIVPLLIGLFWEVEHAAIYKPTPNLRGIVRSTAVLQRRTEVLAALRGFEVEFAAAVSGASI